MIQLDAGEGAGVSSPVMSAAASAPGPGRRVVASLWAAVAMPYLTLALWVPVARAAGVFDRVPVAADEHPVAGASVVLLGAGQGELALHPIADHFTADDRGEFVFHAPDGSGAPVAGALVRATPRDGDPDALHPTTQALSDAAGRFTLEGLDPGPHAVVASHAGHASAVAQGVPAGATDVVLDLHAGGALTGRVTAAEGGAPVPSFTIAVTRRDGPVKEVSVAVRSVVDPDGRFTVADLEPGDYRVRASAMTQAPSPPVDATVPDPPATAAPLAIALTRGGKLVGKIVDADGDR